MKELAVLIVVVALFSLLLWGVVSCATFSAADGAQLEGTAGTIAKCQAEGRAAPDGGNLAAYDACMKDAGLK